MKQAVMKVAILLLLSPSVFAANIVASIKPIQLIALEITQGVSEPDLLVSSNASPHDYALKPSDVKKARQADLVIWFGPELESFLPKVLAGNEQTLQLSVSDNLSLKEFSAESHKGHDHGGHASDSHETENHDPHVWLGPIQAKQTAKLIADKLAVIDADNSARYLSNYQLFADKLDLQVARMRDELVPYKDNGFYVFHDGYSYFEDFFELNKRGYFTLSPERKPGAKTLIQIKKALNKGEAKCVFSEPQFKPSIVKSVTRGTNVYVGELDPLATGIEAKADGYFAFLDDMTQRYIECLSN